MSQNSVSLPLSLTVYQLLLMIHPTKAFKTRPVWSECSFVVLVLSSVSMDSFAAVVVAIGVKLVVQFQHLDWQQIYFINSPCMSATE